ncbi:carboxypeptidase regulatory-like domain-containing protein [Methanothermobacter sp. K4]|uniref:carboxypeptidase regulatory-like domain-containing protein n=1 Tax=Methanothermobacter sp. K4 TaxID=2913262 RepID=UPI001EDC78AC|nr:carboxypeptidase regulatory-like domain-containing protein [Methanothermobacter sp. K4]MCG2828468.1 carboxypeptidase regulatory-like domain-containing protein [Methanothermobacter sp. K4]
MGLLVLITSMIIFALNGISYADEISDPTIPPPDTDPSGTVRSWTGTPIENATVKALQGGVEVAENTTNALGAYNLILPPGEYELMASASGHTQSSVTVDVTEPIQVDFELAELNSFYGIITDPRGVPLEGVIVEVRESNGITVADGYTGPDGRYLVNYGRYFLDHPGATSAQLTLMAFRGDLFTGQETRIVVPGESHRVDLELEHLTSIAGTVRGAGTSPGSVPVTLILDGGALNGYTDAYGNFHFELAGDDALLVRGIRVEAYGYEPYIQDLSVGVGDSIILNIILTERSSLTVNVTNSSGYPVEHALVSVPGRIGYTGEDGLVKFAVEDGEITVTVSHPLYAPESRTIQVDEGENTLSIELVRMGLPVEVWGRVLDAATLEPLEGVEVVVSGPSVYLNTYTDVDGNYLFTASSPGLISGIQVKLTARRWMYRLHQETLRIPESGFERLIHLEHETVLSGTVRNPDGGVVYAAVNLSYPHNGEIIQLTSHVDEDGYYLFYGVESSDTGNYDLHAEHPLYRPYHALITLNSSEENTHDIVMGYYDGSVTFTVLNWTGDPVQGVGVQLRGPGYLYGLSGSDGTVPFTHLPDGQWVYSIDHYGYVPVTGNITLSGGSQESVTVRLIRKGLPVTLQGHVYDTGGHPLRGVRLVFWPDPNPGYTSISGTTDSSGFYTFSTQSYPQLVSGLAGTLETYLSHYRDAVIPMLIGEGTITLDIYLERWQSNITVNVTDIYGNPVSGAYLYLWGPDRYNGVTGPDGLAVFESSPPSEEWDIAVYHDNYYAWDGYWYTLEENQNLTVNAILVPRTIPCRIGGTVVDDVGVPIYNVNVDLYYINALKPERWGNTPNTKTDARGRFSCSLYDTTANIMRLVFSKDGYRNLTVDIMPWELPVNRTFTLQLDVVETGRVQGYVRNFMGGPLSGVTVTASRVGYPSISNITDSSGFYSFDLPAGNYLFTASSPSHITVSKATTVAPNLIIPVDFELHLRNSVYGRVLHENFNSAPSPVDGALVELVRDGASVASTLTDSEGRYEIAAPISGSYNLTVALHPYESISETVNLQETSALLREIVLRPGPYSGFHGTVTDAVTGLPLGGVTVTLRRYIGEFVDLEIEVITGSDGSYSFQSLYPWRDYTLDFEKPGYVPVRDLWFFPDTGEDVEHNQPLQPLISTLVEGQILCWAGPLQGEVVLDGAISMITGPDGRFEFTDLIPGYHVLTAYVGGWAESVYFLLGNGEHLHQDVVFRTFVIDRYPSPGEVLRELQSVGVRLFGGREGAVATLNLYPGTAATGTPLPGVLSWTGDWLIFTPSSMPPRGPCTARVEVPGEVTATWTFQYLPPTSNPPVITSFSPQDGSFLRKPSTVPVTVAVRNDPGNGLSLADSGILLDNVPVEAQITGDNLTGIWTMSATLSGLSAGWHTLTAIAIDPQGLGASLNWRIFVSHSSGPIISNLRVTPAFSPGRGSMHITADLSEPVRSVSLLFEIPSNSVELGGFEDRIDGYWSGWLRDWQRSFIPPDGEIHFTIMAVGMDGAFSNTLGGSTIIDTTGPEIILTDPDVLKSRNTTINGLLNDLTGIFSFNATSKTCTVTPGFTATTFKVEISAPSDGYHEIVMNATDILGNFRRVVYRVLIDTSNPLVQFTAPGENSTVRPGTLLSFRVSDGPSGLWRGYLMYSSTRRPDPVPQDIRVLLDGNDITGRLEYGRRTYSDPVSSSTYGYCYTASLESIEVTYNPRLYGFLNDGQHTLQVTVKDRAGNEETSELHFSSFTGNPEIIEKSIDMISEENETLILIFDVQENSDGGFDKFMLNVDGSTVAAQPLITPGLLPYMCNVRYEVTGNFAEGPHTVSLTVTDGRGFSGTLDTGFYHLERTPVSLQNFNARYMYIPDISVYSGNHTHDLKTNSSYYFKHGSSALHGYCSMDGPSRDLLRRYSERSSNMILPMGGQLAFTIAETPYMNAADAEFLSLWMTDIEVINNVYWGWGGGILVYFDDGRGYNLLVNNTTGIPGFDLLSTLNPPAILYVRHEAPWVNWAGVVDNSVASRRGADGRIWKNYILKIPEGLNTANLRLIFVWETVNWFQDRVGMTVSVSSKIDHVEFVKSIVDRVYPDFGEEDVKLKPTIWAQFKVPLDTARFSSEVFHLRNSAGGIINGTASYDQTLQRAYFTPFSELGGLKTFTGYVSQDIRTIYGVVLPKIGPYTWKFTTARGHPSLWQTIMYNGEEYCIYLVWGPDYAGGKPGYLYSGNELVSTYGTLLEIQVLKRVGSNYYEIGDMDLKRMIFQAAQRKAFYTTFNVTSPELISQSTRDWIEDRAGSWSAWALWGLAWLVSDPAPIPDDDEVIKDMIALILGDGSTPATLTGVEQALSWFSTGLTGASKINDAVEKLREMKAKKAGNKFEESVVGDVLEIAEFVKGELDFQRELWEYVFKCMWQLRVAENYRPQLTAILPYTSGGTQEAISEFLSASINTVKRDVAIKVAEHIGKTTVSLIKDAIIETVSKNPYGKIVVTTLKVFFKIASFTRWDDVHASSNVAVAYSDAEYSFHNAREALVSTFKLVSQDRITVNDVTYPPVAGRLWYGAGGYFYDTMLKIARIMRNWPTSDRSSWDAVIPVYERYASEYLKRSGSFIPEVLSSNTDIMSLLTLIKGGTQGKPSRIYLAAYSPVALLVTAPDGRRIGYDPTRPEGQRIVNDFGAGAFYNSPYSEPQVMVIPAGIGELRIQAFGVDTDSYRITVEVLDEDGNPISGSEWTGNITPGVYKFFSILIDQYGSTFKYDSRAPVIRVTGVSGGGRYTGTVKPLISVADDNLEGWFATLNGKLYSGGPVSSPGVYTLVVRATDGVNVVYSTVIFMIQGVSPVKPPGEGEQGGARETAAVTEAYTVSGAVSEVPSRAVVPPAEMVNVTPTGVMGGYDYTWLAVSLLVSVLIIGVYGALRRRNT